jgi:hypothetical protein
MKKFLAILSIAACGAVAVGQTNDYSNRNVRDPVQLQAKINADLYATDARIDALEGSTNVNGAGAFKSATIGALAVQTNATVGGTFAVTGIATLAATQTVFSAAAAPAPTNLVAGDGVGINVRINGTNYLLHAKPN